MDRPYTVVSNGPLLATLERPDGRRTFHHRMDFPHVPYLVSIAIGDWATTTDAWEGVDLTYHVPRARASEVALALGKTPEMLAFLSAETGVKYPHSVYRQVAVTDYIYGGMENIAATTLTVDTLHPERVHRDRPSDSLVAHEAAHQWFGNYVTCSDWADTWLNEGFATYYAALTLQHVFGPEQWAVEIEGMRKGAIDADAAKRRPVVWNRYESPDEVFDGHGYSKGAMILHALRRELGDALYRKAIHAWLVEHAGHGLVRVQTQRDGDGAHEAADEAVSDPIEITRLEAAAFRRQIGTAHSCHTSDALTGRSLVPTLHSLASGRSSATATCARRCSSSRAFRSRPGCR